MYIYAAFIKEWSVALTFSLVVLVISLFGLFVPVYVAGRERVLDLSSTTVSNYHRK